MTDFEKGVPKSNQNSDLITVKSSMENPACNHGNNLEPLSFGMIIRAYSVSIDLKETDDGSITSILNNDENDNLNVLIEGNLKKEKGTMTIMDKDNHILLRAYTCNGGIRVDDVRDRAYFLISRYRKHISVYRGLENISKVPLLKIRLNFVRSFADVIDTNSGYRIATLKRPINVRRLKTGGARSLNVKVYRGGDIPLMILLSFCVDAICSEDSNQ